jgi:hypothetical protein
MEDDMEQKLIGVNQLAVILDVPKSWLYGKSRVTGKDAMPLLRVGKYIKARVDGDGNPYEVMAWLEKRNKENGYG